MGHIKYNHVNKMLFLDTVRIAILAYIYQQEKLGGLGCMLAYLFVPYFLINKRFEWQADNFACKEALQAKGLIRFLERIKAKEMRLDTDLAKFYEMVVEKTSKCSEAVSSQIWVEYYVAKCSTALAKGFLWLYHDTPMGGHPATDLRIDNAKRIAEEQEALK